MFIARQEFASKLASRRTRGLTLMEVAMVLAMIGVVVAGALIYFNQANTQQKTTAAFGQLSQIQQAVRSLYSGQANFAGLTTAVMANSDALPASMVSGTTLRHAFNGAVTVSSASASAGANSGFSVEFGDVPQDACQAMLTKDLGRGVFSVGASTVRAQPNLPFTLPQASASCSASYNDITWVFN